MYFEYYVLENLIINYIIISCTSILTKKYNSRKNKLFGASIGALYATMYVYPSFQIFFKIPFKIAIMTFIILISFKHHSKADFIKTSAVFYLVNIFISGTAYFIIYFTGISHMKISFLICLAYVSCEILKRIYREVRMISYLNESTKEIKIKALGKDFKCSALIDSGNMLKDPFSGNEVVMIDVRLIQDLIPQFLKEVKYSDLDFDEAQKLLENMDSSQYKKVRLIPYKHAMDSVSKVVIGFKADYVEIDNYKIGDIILGIGNFDEDYEAILSPNLIPNI